MFNIVRRRSSLDCRSSTRQAAGGHLSTRQAVSGRSPHVANLIFNIERLIDAALTLLRAYVVAGRPAVAVGNRGGFEEWIALIASAIRWAGGADVLACGNHDDDDEDSRESHETLLAWWESRWPNGVVAREALAELQAPSTSFVEGKLRERVLDALRILCGAAEVKAVGPRDVGHALSSLREVFVGGRAFDATRATGAGKIWAVIRRNVADAAQ